MSAPFAATDTIGRVLRAVAERLAAVGIEEPRREARLLLAAALRIDLAALIAGEDRPIGEDAARVAMFLGRRATREPLSRILGRREFHGLDLVLDAETLDPRPDTETLVDAVLEILTAEGRADARLRLLDLGTGTGAILLALLFRLPGATGIGIDIAPGAIRAARNNAEAHDLKDRAAFAVGDLLESVSGRYDVIVSNPPYIPSGEIAGLEPEVRLHDPVRALDGGVDGLGFYRRIGADAPLSLEPGGLLALEVGEGQAGQVEAILIDCGFNDVRRFSDLAGKARVLTARWRAR